MRICIIQDCFNVSENDEDPAVYNSHLGYRKSVSEFRTAFTSLVIHSLHEVLLYGNKIFCNRAYQNIYFMVI